MNASVNTAAAPARKIRRIVEHAHERSLLARLVLPGRVITRRQAELLAAGKTREAQAEGLRIWGAAALSAVMLAIPLFLALNALVLIPAFELIVTSPAWSAASADVASTVLVVSHFFGLLALVLALPLHRLARTLLTAASGDSVAVATRNSATLVFAFLGQIGFFGLALTAGFIWGALFLARGALIDLQTTVATVVANYFVFWLQMLAS